MTASETAWQASKGLSWSQRRLLRQLFALQQEASAEAEGVLWEPAKWQRQEGKPWTESARAATSRTLRRLEERGLLVRLGGGEERRRTDRVRLTEVGRLVAERDSKSRAAVNHYLDVVTMVNREALSHG